MVRLPSIRLPRKSWDIAYILAALVLFAMSQRSFIWRWHNVPQGTSYTYQQHEVTMDYLEYLGVIRESKAGAWRIPDMYTTEPTGTSANFFYFILLGKIAAVTGMTPVFMYHLGRAMALLLYLTAVLSLCRLLLGKAWGTAAALCILIAGPPATLFGRMLYPEYGVPAWWMSEPLHHLDMLPHHMTSAAILILCAIGFVRTDKRLPVRRMALLGAGSVLSTMSHPVTGLAMIGIFPFTAAYETVLALAHRERIPISRIVAALLMATGAGIVILWMRQDMAANWPFNMWFTFDVAWYDRYADYIRDFFIGAGILSVPALISAIAIFLRTGPASWKTVAVWGALPYAAIIVSTQLGISKFRFALLLPYIPLVLLSVRLVRDVTIRIRKPVFRGVWIIACLFLFLQTAVPSLLVFHNDRPDRESKMEEGMYISSGMKDVMSFLNTLPPHTARIFTTPHEGALLVAYAPVLVYIGNYMKTIDFEYKQGWVSLAYAGLLDGESARRIFRDGKLTHILVHGPGQEGVFGKYGVDTVKVAGNDETALLSVTRVSSD